MAAYPPTVTALQVGSYFVQQYYQVLQTSPDFVYQFYTDTSTVLRIDGDKTETATATQQIHELLMSLSFTGIEIKTAQSLDSWNGGVIVVVSGSVLSQDYGGRRNFVQTFFLAPQEKGFFVLNDIFHFLDEEQIHQHPAEILAQNQYDSNLDISNPLPEPDYVPVVESQAREYVASSHIEENESIDKYSLPEQQQQHQVLESSNVVEETHVEDLTTSFSHAMNTVQDSFTVPVEEPVGEPQKHTYASILRVPKVQSTSYAAPQRYVNKSEPPTSEWDHTPQSTQPFYTPTVMGSEKSSAESTEALATQDEEGEGRSVYVRNLSSTISALDIEEEFKNFGIIKPEGVVVRNRKDVNVYYAFVEFEDIVGAQNAIKASPVQIGGRPIYIEERRPSRSGVSRGRGGRGRGRAGGYPVESSSSSRGGGRFGGRSFGGSRGNGDGFERRGGNGYYGRPTEERGILGNHVVSRNGQQNPDDAAAAAY